MVQIIGEDFGSCCTDIGFGIKDDGDVTQANKKKNPRYLHPDLTHTKLPFANCICASDVPHFGPPLSLV